MNGRNRVELIALADGKRLVRLNGNNIHMVRDVTPNLNDNTVTITLDADFTTSVDDGELSQVIEQERVVAVMENRKAIEDAYCEGRIIYVRPFGTTEAWGEIHRISNPHDFDFEAWEYAFPKGAKK